MEIGRCTIEDFQRVLDRLGEFWESDAVRPLHHPMLVHEFGDTASVVRDGGLIAAYLFGFLAQTGPVGYVHLVAVRRSHRGRGLGRRLYERFAEQARAGGCRELKAITSPANAGSIAFHRSLGMEPTGDADADGVPYVPDYAGPGTHRVVFRASLYPALDASTVAKRSSARRDHVHETGAPLTSTENA